MHGMTVIGMLTTNKADEDRAAWRWLALFYNNVTAYNMMQRWKKNADKEHAMESCQWPTATVCKECEHCGFTSRMKQQNA